MTKPMGGAPSKPYVSPASFDAIRNADEPNPADVIEALDDVAHAFRGALDAMSFTLEYLTSEDNKEAWALRQPLIDAIFQFQAAVGIE